LIIATTTTATFPIEQTILAGNCKYTCTGKKGAGLPSKRKEKLREDERYEDGGWFAISDDMWLEPGEKPRKVRLVADTHFQRKLVEVLQANGLEVLTAQELGLHRMPDEQLLHEVDKRGMTLLTRDHDFLSERKYPIHKSGKIVFVDGDGETIGTTIGFALLILLIKTWGSTNWYGKVRTTSENVYLRFHGSDGKNRTYQFKAMRPHLYAREFGGFDEGK